MDAQNALEAVEAIRNTVPEAEQAEFDAGLAEQLGLVAETAGPLAVEAAAETDEVKLDTSEVKESLFGQLDVAHSAHTKVVDALNTGRRKNRFEAADRETVEAEFTTWLTEEKLNYITEQVAAGRQPHVLATPNVEIGHKTYEKAERKFGQGQPYVDIYTGVISQCTPAELSGTDPNNGNKVYFNVVFEDFDKELYGIPEVQKAGLAKLQKDNPFLEAPSRLKSLTYNFTLREACDDGVLRGPGTADLTFMRDYMVDPKPVGGRLCVPHSIVYDHGRFLVYYSSVRDGGVGRALVG